MEANDHSGEERPMIDLHNIERYRENNRIEAKLSTGGLPESLWETYSAFANTLGGVILLGVEELPDHSLRPVDLPDPQWLIREFREILNDPRRVSVNILSERSVSVVDVEGKHIVAIEVPRARRYDRPVYVGGDPMTGTYRRSGDGDYRCSREEVRAMLLEASISSSDTRPLEGAELSALDSGTLRRYQLRLERERPDQGWRGLDVQTLLTRLNAAAADESGALRPTAAGLLMFGQAAAITAVFPHYRLDYRDSPAEGDIMHLVSSAGDWSGNIFDFYLRVRRALTWDAAPSVADAVGEALANCLINADYREKGGILVRREPHRICLSNPGAFCIDLDAARSGGLSDPRNLGLVRLFQLVSLSRRTGGGIPGIYAAWRRQSWPAPQFREDLSPERTTLELDMAPQKASAEPQWDDHPAVRQLRKEAVIDLLTEQVCASGAEIADRLGLRPPITESCLKELMAEGIVVTDGEGPHRTYRLKER